MKEYKDAAERVRAMSLAMERVKKAMEALDRDLDRLGRLEATVSDLDDYQRSGLWLQDFEADEAGAIPGSINRAVLSQDGLYNLLQDWDSLKKLFPCR